MAASKVSWDRKTMHVLVGGASGFLGSALIPALQDAGHRVTQLVRHPVSGSAESRWDPATGSIDQAIVDSADAVINLSGATIVRWPRTAAYQQVLRDSRLGSTRTLATAIAASSSDPIFLSGSASGFYGQDRGEQVLTESSEQGDGFLAQLCADWELAAAPAAEAGSRLAFLRTSLVLGSGGGLLGPLKPAFQLGLGARLGSGRQFMPLITRHDWVRAVLFCLEHDVTGPVNLCAPDDVTNARFTDTVGEQMHRPTFMVAPSPILKLILGDMAGDLLGSVRMRPDVLTTAGFHFDQPTLDAMVESALNE